MDVVDGQFSESERDSMSNGEPSRQLRVQFDREERCRRGWKSVIIKGVLVPLPSAACNLQPPSSKDHILPAAFEKVASESDVEAAARGKF